MKLISVNINNILSIEEASVSFKDNGITLVDGWNYDDSRANGAGKTAMFNAVTFGLYGKIPRKVTQSEILRRGCKKGFVEVFFQIADDTWMVRREKPNNVLITKNSEPQLLTQEELDATIGLNYSQFLLSIYTAQDEAEMFIFLNDSGKKDEILKLLDVSELTRAKDRLSAGIKSLESKLQSKKTEIASKESNISMLQGFIVDPDSFIDGVAALNIKIKEVCDQKDEWLSVSKPDLSKFKMIEEAIQTKRDAAADLKYLISDKRNEHRNSTAQLRKVTDLPIVTCPSCDAGLHIVGTGLCSAENRQEKARQIQQHNTQTQETISRLAQEINALETEYDKVLNWISTADTKLAEKKQLGFTEYQEAQSKLRGIQDAQYKLESQRQSLEIKQKQNQGYIDSIEKTTQELQELKLSLSGIEADLSLKQAQLMIVSPTGVPAYIMDAIVDKINAAVSEHMSILWPNATYRLMSHRENKSGEIRAKFSEVISISGKECSLGSLSGGEKGSVALAVSLAFSSIVEQLLGREISQIILDEPFDGLDSISRERALELLNTLADRKQILVIDHASELRASFSDIIKVEKRNDITTISQQ